MKLSASVYEEFLASWKEQLFITHVEVIPPLPGSPNMHFRASSQRASAPTNQYFIKVTTNAQAHQRERSALRVIAPKLDSDMQPVTEGATKGEYYWRAFPWLNCYPVHPEAAEEYREIGRTLGRMHAYTASAAFPELQSLSLGTSLWQEVEDIQHASPDLGKDFTRPMQWLSSYESEWLAYEQTLPQVLLHRDFGLRNLVRKEQGELMIVDYEHVALGPCYLDLTKCLDRELRQPEHLQFFQQGYAEVMHIVFHHVPVEYTWGTRFWGAARFLYHGIKHNDPIAIEYSLTILERLKEDWNRASRRF